MRNVYLNKELKFEGTKTIDLNGYTITFDGTAMTTAISNSGALTLKNGTIDYKNARNMPGESVTQYSVILNSNTLNTSALTINVNVKATCDVTMTSFEGAIADDNSCPGVFVVNTSGNAEFNDTDITLNVEQAVSGNAGLMSSNGTEFAGVKPIIIFQNGNGSTTTIENGSVLTSATSVPGGVIGLYMDSNNGMTATIDGSTIEVTNGNLGWARPVFADGKGNNVSADTINVTITNSTIESHDTLTNKTVNDFLEYMKKVNSTIAGNFEKAISTEVNRVYGLRAKRNSVITFDSKTEVVVDKVEEGDYPTLLQYATDTAVDYTQDQTSAGIRGKIVNGDGKYWNNDDAFVDNLE